jgi:DNA mismatch endonuclease (patch repair protein)
MIFRRAKIAIFIDGCFWHGCPTHYQSPKTNSQYWREKIAGNVARDRRNAEMLRACGWSILRFWTHEETEGVADRIMLAVRQQLQDAAARMC